MPKSPEELEKMFSELEERQAKSEKEHKQQLEMAQRDVKQFKEIADKNAEELRKFKLEAEEREKKITEAAAKARETEIAEFVESQVKAGRVLPAFKEKLTAFMKSLTSESTVLEFTEKDGSKRSHTQVSLFKELLTKILKPVMPVDGQEFSVAGESEEEEIDGTQQPVQKFAEIIVGGEKKKLPVEGADEAARAYEYQAAQKKLGREVSYEDALIFVYREKKKVPAKA